MFWGGFAAVTVALWLLGALHGYPAPAEAHDLPFLVAVFILGALLGRASDR